MMATAAVVLALSLAYGLVAVVGYMVSFDKTAYRLLRGESNLFFSLAQWHDNKLSINVPPDLDLNFPTLVFIYDTHGKLLCAQLRAPDPVAQIMKSLLYTAGLYDLVIDTPTLILVVGHNPLA